MTRFRTEFRCSCPAAARRLPPLDGPVLEGPLLKQMLAVLEWKSVGWSAAWSRLAGCVLPLPVVWSASHAGDEEASSPAGVSVTERFPKGIVDPIGHPRCVEAR